MSRIIGVLRNEILATALQWASYIKWDRRSQADFPVLISMATGLPRVGDYTALWITIPSSAGLYSPNNPLGCEVAIPELCSGLDGSWFTRYPERILRFFLCGKTLN
jgi:hypothetical protein